MAVEITGSSTREATWFVLGRSRVVVCGKAGDGVGCEGSRWGPDSGCVYKKLIYLLDGMREMERHGVLTCVSSFSVPEPRRLPVSETEPRRPPLSEEKDMLADLYAGKARGGEGAQAGNGCVVGKVRS